MQRHHASVSLHSFPLKHSDRLEIKSVCFKKQQNKIASLEQASINATGMYCTSSLNYTRGMHFFHEKFKVCNNKLIMVYFNNNNKKCLKEAEERGK